MHSDGDLSRMSQWISWDSGMDETTCPQHLARLTRYLDGQLRVYPNAPGTIYPQLPPRPAMLEPDSGPMPSPNTHIHSSQPAHCSPTPEEIILLDPEDSDHDSSTDSNILTLEEEERTSNLDSNSESEDPGKPTNPFTLNRFNSVRQRKLSERAKGFMHTH